MRHRRRPPLALRILAQYGIPEPTPERAAVVIEAFAAWCAEFIADPVAADIEVEELRRKLQAERPRAERLVPRWA